MPTRRPLSQPEGFNTLAREYNFRHPPKDGSVLQSFQDLVAPQIEAFDSLSEDSEGDGTGLLNLGIRFIPEKVVFDQIGIDGADYGKARGNRISCVCATQNICQHACLLSLGVQSE